MLDLLSLFQGYDFDGIVSAVLTYVLFSLAGTGAAIQRVRRPDVKGSVGRISLVSGLVGAGLGVVFSGFNPPFHPGIAIFLASLFGGYAFAVPPVAGSCAAILVRRRTVNGSVGPISLVSAGLLGGGIGAVFNPVSVISIGMTLFDVSVIDGLISLLLFFAIGAALAAFFLALYVAGAKMLRALKGAP